MILRRCLYILGLIITTILFSCSKPRRHNEITKIELAKSGAWSDPGAAIIIDSALTYKYYGVLKSGTPFEKRNYYIGKVSEEFWDTLNRKLEKLKFKDLSGIDSEQVADVPYLEFIIHWKNAKTRIIKQYSPGKDSIINMLTWLDTSYKKIKLKKVNVAFNFETILQEPLPSLKQIKFPPPI